MHSLFKNTAANIGAFAIVSALNLAIVPILIRAYGLEFYGLIVLARLLLPSGALGLFDLGLTEATTKHVSQSLAHGDRLAAGRAFTLGILLVGPIALILALPLLLAPHAVSSYLLGLSGTHLEYDYVIMWTGLCLILIFPGLIGEGVLRGQERFGLIRVLDVATSLTFVGGSLIATFTDQRYTVIILIYATATTLRAITLLVLATYSRSPVHLPLAMPQRHEFRDQLLLAWRMLQGKVLSAIFTHTAPLAISHALNPAAVGIYDAISRLPRFCKSVVGLVNTVILPITARLDAKAAHGELQTMLSVATRLGLALAGVPLVVSALFGRQILGLWLGRDYAGFGGWFALLMLWPIASLLNGVGIGMLTARSDPLKYANRITIVQVAVLVALGLGLLPVLQERAFFLALVAALWFVLPAQLVLITRTFHVSAGFYPGILTRFVIALVPSGVAAWVLQADVRSPTTIALAVLAALIIGWCAAFLLLFSRDEIKHSGRSLQSMFSSSAKAAS